MKRGKFLLFLCIFCVCFVFFSIGTFAEETTENVVVTYQDQLNDFWNKWFGPLAAVGFGGLTTGGVIAIFFKLISKRIDKSEKQNEETTNEAKDSLTKAKESYEDSNKMLMNVVDNIKEDFNGFSNEYNALVEKYKKQFDIQTGEIDLLLTHISVLKDLMCKLVASNPELASNGYATEIIKICDETNLFEIKKNLMLAYEKDKEGENNE